MKVSRSCILVVAALLVAPFGLMSCLKGGTLTAITVTPTNSTVAKGTTTPFVATAVFSDGTTLVWTTAVTWNSSDPAIALVSNVTGSQGFVTSEEVGAATITATDLSNGFSGSTTVTVSNAINMIVTPSNPVISLATTTQQQFTAMETFANGTELDLTTLVFWESSDPAVAQISNSTGSYGLATLVSAGTTTITATDLITNITGTTILTVTP
ncbi:MAG TPA: Ig-like domain-containing protein [Nitrospirota bacterium]|nr:Ig-like domain-containing protein [Nitrospirota bacterium]